jgi:hypothetical protein
LIQKETGPKVYRGAMLVQLAPLFRIKSILSRPHLSMWTWCTV